MSESLAIILNGISRKKKTFYRDIHPVIASRFAVEIFETKRAGHAVELAADAVAKGFKIIIAAGGDGTLNQVVNGILQNQLSTQPIMGLIPLGTGNDFARTCGITGDPHQLKQLLEANAPRSVDVGHLTCHNSDGEKVTRYFINASSMGMGPAVVQRLLTSSRSLGPALTYWKAITATFVTHRPQEIHCTASGWGWRGNVRVMTIANGRSFGNGLYIAPDAVVDDGMLDVFICGELPLWKFLMYQQSLKKPKKILDNMLTYTPATKIELTSTEQCPIETEGELAGFLPAQIEVKKHQIQFLR